MTGRDQIRAAIADPAETTEGIDHPPTTAARSASPDPLRPPPRRPPAGPRANAANAVTDRGPMIADPAETTEAADRAPVTAGRVVMIGPIEPHIVDRNSRTTRLPRSTHSEGPLPPSVPNWRPLRRHPRRSPRAR